MAKNGYVSTSKRSKHIKAKYFFIKHFHNTGEIDLQYCPPKQMWAEVHTKPLQGAKFRLMHAFLMNCPIDYSDDHLLVPTSSLPTTSSSSPSTVCPPTFIPTDNPTVTLMKLQSLQSTPSPWGCIETAPQSPGTTVPIPQRHTNTPMKNVMWREALEHSQN